MTDDEFNRGTVTGSGTDYLFASKTRKSLATDDAATRGIGENSGAGDLFASGIR